MKKKSGCFRSVLVVICVFVVAVIFRACTLKASAETIQLNVPQTLALYGTSINATLRSQNLPEEQLTFRYIGNTYDWIKNHESGLYIPFTDPLYAFPSGSGTNNWYQWSHFGNGLIYACPWTVINVDFPTSSNSRYVNFYLNQSLPLNNISRFRQYVFWSGFKNASGSYGSPQYSFVQYNTTFSGTKKYNALYNGAWNLDAQRYTYGIWPSYDLNTVADDTQIEEWMAPMYGVYTDMNASSSASTFDIVSAEYNLNAMDTVDGARSIPPFDGIATGHDKWLFIIITCPQLDATDFVGPTMPPTTTMTTQTTQLTGYTGETISGTYSGIGLDGIATDIQEIINNQRWQIMQNDVMIQNGRRTNDNLSIIIEQLNRIYTNMLANGEISPELVQAHPLDTIPPDIAGQIQTVLRGTWPTMPSNAFGDAPAVFGEMFDLFRDPVFSTIFYLGVVSLALSVAGWFLFKGRN